MEKLNRAKAQALYEENAILFGSVDAIPEERVAELFGEEAVAHVNQLNSGYKYRNVYGIGDYQQGFLTYQGFLAACTYHNVSKLKHEKEEDGRTPDSEDILFTIVAMYLQYMETLTEGLPKADEDQEEALLKALETATGAKPNGVLARQFLVFAAGLDKGLELATKLSEIEEGEKA